MSTRPIILTASTAFRRNEQSGAPGVINGPSYAELAVDTCYPKTIPSVAPELLGRTVHAGGRCRVFLDSHVQYIKDTRTPL